MALVEAERSLSGVRLWGNKIVRLVYVDEAGLSNPKHEPFVVVCGVVVDADKKLIAVERAIQKLIDRHIPEPSRPNFVFHAKELFNGGGKVFKRNDPDWPLSKRLSIANDIARLPAKFDLPLAFGFIEKAAMSQTAMTMFGPSVEKTTAAHVMAFISCAMQVEHWMRANASQEVCLMVVEDNQTARQLITEQQHAQQDPLLNENLSPELGKHFPFRKIKEVPLFAGKQQSKVLQLADFCAYVFKRIRMGDRRYRDVWEPLRKQLAVLEIARP